MSSVPVAAVSLVDAMPCRRLAFGHPRAGADIGPPHRVLGLRADEADPLRIIVAAQIRLRRWRRVGSSREAARSEVQKIVAAREALLQRTYGRRLAERA
jgi:hypothetical protein